MAKNIKSGSFYASAKGYAKVNLGLWITGVDRNGMHKLQTLYYALPDLYDTVTITESDKIEVTGELADGLTGELPKNKDNLVYKVLERAVKSSNGRLRGLKAHIQKNIPIAAGLAGGSADAAAAYLAISGHTPVADLGADMMFSVYAASQNGNAAAIGTNHGDSLKFLNTEKWHLNVDYFTQPEHITAAECYKRYDQLVRRGQKRVWSEAEASFNINYLTEMLSSSNWSKAKAHIHNDLEDAALNICPDLVNRISVLKNSSQNNCTTLISGSGPTIIQVSQNG